jgi:hypothetical protein
MKKQVIVSLAMLTALVWASFAEAIPVSSFRLYGEVRTPDGTLTATDPGFTDFVVRAYWQSPSGPTLVASYTIHRSAVRVGGGGTSNPAVGGPTAGVPSRAATSATEVVKVGIISVRVVCEAYCGPSFLE